MITKKTCRVLIVAVMGIRIKGELTGVRNLFLTPVLNFEGERPWLEPVPFILLHLLAFLAGHNIKNNIVITKKTCRVLIVAVMGKGSKVN